MHQAWFKFIKASGLRLGLSYAKITILALHIRLGFDNSPTIFDTSASVLPSLSAINLPDPLTQIKAHFLFAQFLSNHTFAHKLALHHKNLTNHCKNLERS